MRRSVALLGLLLSGAGLAAAQDITFTPLASGGSGAPGAASNRVIRSAQELHATGVDALLPAGTTIDWHDEMVVAVLMGTKNTGGYSIEVTKIEEHV